MLKRKRRKGFWWYSWILVLLTIGGAVGGYFWGEKKWEKADKEYRSTAILDVPVRELFGVSSSDGATGAESVNRNNALKSIRGVKTLKEVMRSLNLTSRWVVAEEECLKILTQSVSAEFGDGNEVNLTVTRNSPKEAEELVNAVADQALEAVGLFDTQKKEKGLELLDEELERAREPIDRALASAASALEANKLPIVPNVDTDLSPYMEIKEILDAKVDLDAAKEDYRQAELAQLKKRSYWDRSLAAPKVIQKGVAPATFSGPEKKPFHNEGTLQGFTCFSF